MYAVLCAGERRWLTGSRRESASSRAARREREVHAAATVAGVKSAGRHQAEHKRHSWLLRSERNAGACMALI